MQLRLLALLLLQPERAWTAAELTTALSAPQSSVHRELARAEDCGIVARDAGTRPHRFTAATEDAFFEPLALLLRRSVGLEAELRGALSNRADVQVAVLHGSWAGGTRRPDSDVDVLVVGDAELQELRRLMRPIGKRAGRTLDITLFGTAEFQQLLRDRASFARRILEAPTVPLAGTLDSVAR